MIEKYGVKGTIKDEIFFTEQEIKNVHKNLGEIKTSISGQNKNLSILKKKMAKIANSKDANVIMCFEYNQKAHKWWEQVFTFKWDSESWHGKGIAVRMNE